MANFPGLSFKSFPLASSSIIQSIQEVSITIAASSTSNTATINSITTGNAFVMWNGQNPNNGGGTNSANAFGYLTITNGTTITATRNNGTTNTLTVYGVVVEFVSSAVVSMQTGTITLGSTVTSNTATISSVSTSDSFIIYGGALNTTTGPYSARTVLVAIDLTNATTVTAVRNLGTDSATVAYTVVELTSGVIKQVQKISVASTSSSTTEDTTITAVDMNNSMVLDNGQITGSAALVNTNLYRQYLTSTTNHRFERVGTATTSRTLKATVVEFNTGYVLAKTASLVSLSTAETQKDTTVSMTDRNKVFVNQNGRTYNSGGSTLNSTQMGALSTSTTNVRIIRNATGSVAMTAAFEMIEFV